MKQKINYTDLVELNGEPIGKMSEPVNLDFLPNPEQVRQSLRTFENQSGEIIGKILPAKNKPVILGNIKRVIELLPKIPGLELSFQK